MQALLTTVITGLPVSGGRQRGNSLAARSWIRGHGRAVSGCRRPIVDPLLTNAVRPLYEFTPRNFSVLDNDDDAGVEPPLRVAHIR